MSVVHDASAHRAPGPLRAYGDVLFALMLRDIRTRMFGSAWGFMFVTAWPLTHILAVVALFSWRGGATPPFGEAMSLWAATGVLPFMCFSYLARFTMLGVVMNRPLLYFPRINVLHLIFSRAAIEVLNSGLVIILALTILTLSGVDVTPQNPAAAGQAILVACLLGLSFGILNGVVAGMFPSWATFFSVVIILLWLTAGIVFVPSQLPDAARYWFSFHPLVHVVEWVREAYYDSYNSIVLSRSYVVSCAVVMLFISLVFERMFRGFILSR